MATVDSSAPAKIPDQSARRRRDSTASKRSSRSRAESTSSAATGALPTHVTPNIDAPSYAELQKAQKLFKNLLGSNDGQWSVAIDHKGNKIHMLKRDGLLPIVKGEAMVEGVTTEQVLGTILSSAARRECAFLLPSRPC